MAHASSVDGMPCLNVKTESAQCIRAGCIQLPAKHATQEEIHYIWDGRRVVEEDGFFDEKRDAQNTVHRHVQQRLDSIKAAFFPRPELVTPDYWEYVKWRGWHRLFSSMSSIFSTQSLLLAVGVGARKTLPAAAGINWVLKDGLGRLGRLTMATRFGESFDSDLKRFRFASSLLYGGALALDYLTPLVPGYFLPMAAAANIGKSVGLTTYISTQPAFFKSFARSENIADISAKAQAQQMAIDTLGLALAVSLNLAVRRNATYARMLPLAMFPILIPGDLYSIYHELRSVHLRTLNKERAEFIAACFVDSGDIPTPEVVSKQERLILPPRTALGAFPLDIQSLERSIQTRSDVDAFLVASQKKKKYFISCGKHGHVSATFRKDSSTRDILQVVLTVAHMRANTAHVIDIPAAESCAQRQVTGFMKKLEQAGWQIEPFTLSRTERMFYT